MKHTLTLLALACASMAASATDCAFNGALASSWPACNVFPSIPKTPTTPASNILTGEQRQQQAAIAGAAARSQASAAAQVNAAGLAANAGAGAGANAGQYAGQGAGAGAGANTGNGNGNNNGASVNVNTGGATGSGDSYLSVALPGAPPAIAPTMVGGAVSSTAFSCGPAQRVIASPVYGTQFGMFSNTEVWLGNTEQTAPYIDENGNVAPYIRIGAHWYGHQVLYSTAVLGVTGATSIGIGGFGSHGGGNAGGGASSGMQRMMTTIQLRLCQIPEAAPVPIVFEALPVPQVKRKPRPAVRRAPCPIGQVLVCRSL